MMNENKIIYRSFLAVLLTIGLLASSLTFATERPDVPNGEKNKDRLAKINAFDPTIFAILNINNLWMWEKQDGKSNHSPAGIDGVYFPRGTKNLIYQDGIVWGARAYIDAALTIPAPFDQEIRVMGATYGTGSREGWIEGFGATARAVPKDDPRATIYKIRRDWMDEYFDENGDATPTAIQDAAENFEILRSAVTDFELGVILDYYKWSWDNWPVDLGAPYIDRNGNGVYDPPPAFKTDVPQSDPSYFGAKELISGGYDEPGIAGSDVNSPADMVIFNIYNDLFRSLRFGSEPTGMEVQNTVWAYKRSDALGNIYFRKVKIINKGGVEIDEQGTIGAFYMDSMYVVQWSDPDLGNAGDDLLGADTLLSMGYVFNGQAVDDTYADFNLPPPAGGYDYLQGPALPSPGDVAVVDLKYKQDFKNLGMTGFSYFSAGSPYSDPSNSDYDTGAIRWYKMMRGFAPLSGADVRYNHPPGVTPGPFPLAGDPVAGTGHFDGLGTDYSFAPGDRRLLIITGPWTMAPGDTQEVVIAFVAGLGADRLSSVSVMKFNDRFAQNTYDALFQVPSAPKAPAVRLSAQNQEVLMEWGSDISGVGLTEESVNEPGEFRFEGYNIYQFPSLTAPTSDAKRIATYDVINELTVILDEGFDQASGQILIKPVHFGSNSGIQRKFVFDRDYLADVNQINNGQEYYLAVTSYSVSAIPGFLPATLESEFKVQALVSQNPFGTAFSVTRDDTLSHTHTEGASDGSAYPIVIDPAALNGHNYKVTFTDIDEDGVTEWTLTDETDGKVLIEKATNQTGDDDYLFTAGFQLRVVGAPLDFKAFQVVANGAGVVDPPEGAAADFQGFPTLRPTDGQQVGAGHWMFHTGDNGTRGSYSAFLARSMRGSNFSRLIPYDWEMRFTGSNDNPEVNGSYAVRAFEDGFVVWVPFELWCIGIGTPDDPSDDFRLIPWILEFTDTAESYGTTLGDHAASGGDNDPFTDWIYWRIPEEHVDYSPGTTGYDNYIAALDFSQTPPFEGTYGYDGAEVIARSVLFNWNGGSAPPYNQDLPEQGTIFRLLTTKPNTVSDVFTFTTPIPEESLELAQKSVEKVGVFPNPYYAFNPLETNKRLTFITFNNLPPKATLRIFNLAGQLVRTIEKENSSQFQNWDLTNSSLLPVASGLYIVHIDMPDIETQKVLKVVIILESEILDVY